MVKFVLIGLGNPGMDYHSTRHNVGFWMLDSFAESHEQTFKHNKDLHADYISMFYHGIKILLIKPTTYMNQSGRYLKKILTYFSCAGDNIILIHDDITLPLADLKISSNKGDGGHNGVSSVISYIGKSIIRFRIGIGGNSSKITKLADYVLSKFSIEELKQLESNKPLLLEALHSLFDNGVDSTMNKYNKSHTI